MLRFAPARTPLPLLVLLGALGCVVAASARQEPAALPPPAGLVHIPAGDVVLGLDEKEGMKMVLAARTPADRWVMAGEIGRHTLRLPDFWLAPTHVTNEMYLEYVQATGARPPATWAALSKEQIQRIIEIGKSTQPGYAFDEERQGEWWVQHWRDEGVSWRMPPDRALEPVVFVSWNETLDYCTWAGLRLPTEAELVRAGRTDGDQQYPFGSAFDREAVSHNGTLPVALAFKRVPVGMLEKNVSSFGIHDLVGNVWSWTSSAYLPFEGFPKGGLRVPGEKRGQEVAVIPNWDGSRKVLKGGNFQLSPEFCRLDVRVGCDPPAAVSVIGFRVASSGAPAADAAILHARKVRSSVLGYSPERDLDGARVLGVERRTWPDMAAIEARRAKPATTGFVMPELPPDYRVFGPCEVLAFTPLADPFERDDYPESRMVEKVAQRDLAFPTLGVFSTTSALAEPELPAGSYVLAWMPAFKDKELLEMGALIPEKDLPKTPVEPDEVKVKRAGVAGRLLLPDKEHLLFLDADGQAAGAVVLLDEFKLLPEKPLPHRLELDLVKRRWDFRIKLPGKSGKAYGLRFAIKTGDPTEMLEGHWIGVYETIRPAPGASSGRLGN